MLRDYQVDLAVQTSQILLKYRIAILSIEMRVGKTLIALQAAAHLGAKKVLFITKKKAIASIAQDFENEGFDFNLTVINYEQASKYKPEYEVVIVDESHSLGAFPKPSLRTQTIKNLVKGNYLMLLSGTLTPESYSQIFHQLWISEWSPFAEYKNFYKWAHAYVEIKQKIISGLRINDYSRANQQKIMEIISKLILTYTREEAGFQQSEVQEKIIYIPNEDVKRMADYIIEKKVVELRSGTIVCDTAAKLQGKVHQIYSGTVKTEEGDALILDRTKAEYIKQNYKFLRIAVYYKFIAEGIVLKQTFKDELTESPEEFNEGKRRIFISQIQSGSMGINLSSADVLIFYNIDFSAVQYWQARARLQTLNRTKPAVVHWLFTLDGIEEKIYKAVMKKKDYTISYFKRDYLNGTGYTKLNKKVS